jgi:2-oxoglutarate dehydrogenase E1 component
MLRLKAAASKLADFTSGTFKPLISDAGVANATRVILCSGKIYWELLAERARLGDTATATTTATTTAIVRVEQLYPLPSSEILAELNRHPNASVLWVQDEPANQGPWPFVSATLSDATKSAGVNREIHRVSRRAAASPATGSIHVHEEEQKALIAEAFSR